MTRSPPTLSDQVDAALCAKTLPSTRQLPSVAGSPALNRFTRHCVV
ncbi:hypothetical protein [Streptomyces chartreusis]